MKKTNLITLLGIIFIYVFCHSAFARTDKNTTIKVGGDHNYPPYEFINKEGKPDGYNTELTLAIAKVMGLNVEVILAPWSEVREKLNNGQIDILQGMSYSEERDKNYDFIPAHAIVNQAIFARQGSNYPSEFSELKSKDVIVQRDGFTYDQMIDRKIGANLIEVDTHVDALRLLSSGKHDFAIVASLPGLYAGKEFELTNIKTGGKPFASMRYGYSVIENNDALYSLFSEGLAILKKTGRHQEIYDKWLGSLEKQGFDWRIISFISAVLLTTLLLIMGATIIWNRQLANKVERRTSTLKKQQQQLIQADKMASLGVLVSGVAHEINNPTSLLLLNTPVLKESYQDIEGILEKHYNESGDFEMGGLKYTRMRTELPKMFDDILDRANRIKRIVDDLKDYSQKSSPDLSEQLDLNDLINTAVRIVKKTIQSSTDHFELKLAPNLPQFLGNSQRIEQVLINLILNSCQALTSTQQSLSIHSFLAENKNDICVEILDQGHGIDPKNITRIMEPFYTTKRETGGTGLGLSVSSNIIEEHNGDITFTSEPDKGTCARITFPTI